MKIHEAQREAFRAQAAETFPRRVSLLARHLPDERADLSTPAGLMRVEALVEEAQGRGFTGERDACKYVTLAFVAGEGFAAEPWAEAVLADPGLPTPTDRIEALWSAAKQRELDEAVDNLAQGLC